MKTIAVVEDNADGRRSLCLLLGRAGFRVEVAVDGCEGVEKGLALPPFCMPPLGLGLPLVRATRP